MLFVCKKIMMSKVIEKRNRKHPFDYQYAENYSLDAGADPVINNSWYFSAHERHLSVYARLGRRSNAEETWFAIYSDGRIYSLKQELFPAGASPVKVEKSGDNWTLSFQGTLNEKDAVDFRATFIAREKPLNFASDMPAERMAIGMANEKWNKAYFEEVQQVSGQCHYEQEGVLEGKMTLNGRSMDFSLPCVRDHSFGKRDWNYMNNHLWLMAVSPSCQFNYSMVSYPAMSVLEVGNYRDGAGQHFMLRADLDLAQAGRGVIPGELAFHVTLDDGRSIPVQARVLAGVSYHFQGGVYALHENIAEFSVDGNTCRGILEIGFNSAPDRYFNQRDLTTIRR